MGILKDFAEMTAGFMHGCNRAVANIPWLDDLIGVTRQKFLNPIVVRRITDSRDPDLQPALALYEARIPELQRFEASDIVRWLTESKETDCFLVAKYKRKVCGFSLFHYYPSRGLGLFAYMVVAKRVGLRSEPVSTQLMLKTLRFVKRKTATGLESFVMEVEDPRRQASKEKRIESLARIRRFSMLAHIGNFSLRAVDISYKQPPLTHLDSDLHQEELLLLYARRGIVKAEMDRAEINKLLDFIYLELYPEGYSDNADEIRNYIAKCTVARSNLDRHLPERARLLGVAELSRGMLGGQRERTAD